jgi:prepilin-type processing-associated H-X9-DG protein
MYYWTGIRRLNSSANFTFVDGSELPQAASNSPYAHWNWYQPLAANRSGYDCVMAYNAYRWASSPNAPLHSSSQCTQNT